MERPPHVVVVTTFAYDTAVYGALRAGAAGFLLKRADPDELTGRESDVLRLMAGGLSNHEVGRRLGVGPQTVKTPCRGGPGEDRIR